MLENAPRQIALVVALVIASVASLLLKPLNWGNDLAGGTELIYEVDKEKAQKQLEEDADWDEFMDAMVTTINARIDPEGVLNAEVLKRGETGIYIGLPKVTEREAREIEDKVTRLGSLRMQICAYNDYESEKHDGKQIFDLAKERDRLQAWIAKEDNKESLLRDPLTIERYHLTPPDEGGPLLPPDQLRWVPHKIEGKIQSDGGRSEEYDYSIGGGANELAKFVVKLFDDADLQNEAKPGEFLLEYVPVNFDERGFTGKDLVADQVVPSTNPQTGSPVVLYEIIPERATEYADLSEENIGNQSAIILDGYIKSAPVYKSRIPGSGMIEGFTIPEAEALAEVLKRGSLQVKPALQSMRTVGPTLGKASIARGMWSLIIGSGVVLLFILFYYRIAGVVATLGILLNVGFIFGAVSFIGATLTLPGLGGLVLTVGMAIDANILIYERIREEMKAGKDLLQSVRHGFDRAMVTILDANITTFIAGLVLYNVGVGPIRGFAVTLMIGIVTSLFTAFFISRLIFHFLLKRKRNTLPMADWFGNLRFNYLSMTKPAFALSATVIIGGMVVFFTTPSSVAYALDFTGGADIRLVTKEPTSAAALKKRLLAPDGAFVKLIGPNEDPIVNTVDMDATGARYFSVKIKVSPTLAKRIEKEAAEADAKGELYQPPYVDAVADTLQDLLVPKAFTNARITAKGSDSRANYADIVVHYSDPVSVNKIREELAKALGESPKDIEVSGVVAGKKDPSVEQAGDLLLEFDVAKSIDTPEKLTSFTDEKLKGAGVPLSNPIPDVATLGGRMVGELKSKAVAAMLIALFCIVMFIRVRFHEYKYGIGAVAALAHDVLVALGLVVLFNRIGLVSSELSLSMIAAFLTIIGYSINDTIVIFDRIRENLRAQAAQGDTKTSFADTINLSINQTMSRTILTSFTTLFVVTALFAVNYGAGSELEGFAFAMIIGVLTGSYSTIFLASPVVLWLRSREKPDAGLSADGGLGQLGRADDPARIPMTSNP